MTNQRFGPLQKSHINARLMENNCKKNKIILDFGFYPCLN